MSVTEDCRLWVDHSWCVGECCAHRDRTNITLPGDQATLVSRVRAAVPASTDIVVVMVHGGSLDITEVLVNVGSSQLWLSCMAH